MLSLPLTSSPDVAERPRDASCLSVASSGSSASDLPLFTNKFCSLLFVVVVHAAGCASNHWCVADCAVNCAVYCMPIVTLVVHRSSRSGHRSLTSYIADDHDLCLPHLHSTLRLGGSLSEYCHDVWCGRTIMVWLHDDEKILKICLFVLTESINVTDRRMNTAWRHRPRLCIASRGKKNTGHCLFLFLSVFFTFLFSATIRDESIKMFKKNKKLGY